jgi:uncharacterized membrane protein
MSHHFRRHLWFYQAAILGILAWAAMRHLDTAPRVALAGDVFFLVYLISAAWRIDTASPDTIRQRAALSDEGILVILLIVIAAVVLSFAALFGLVNASHPPHLPLLLASLAAVPLGWLTLHTLMAWHYAHEYYAPHPHGGDAGGLEFPGTKEPEAWDFVYFSFVIGMAAQVSDVQVSDGGIRRMVLFHGVVSFFFNAVILALAVNVAIAEAH